MAIIQGRAWATTCGASQPLFDRSRQLADRLPHVYTRAARKLVISELLLTLLLAIELGRR
jgi:hypothetical protein